MNTKRVITIGGSLLMFSLSCALWLSRAQGIGSRVVRMAELEIDPAQLEAYKSALKEEIETSIRIEPGVLILYAVSLKENPAHIRILETYADIAAYKAHIEAPHFKRYKNLTQNMVKSLKLVETDPIVLGAKSK